MFRTGDIGRWTWEGELELLGRSDDQVKIRGYRVQLGEIEATIARHEDVRETVVTACATSIGQCLVAYVVKKDGAQITSDQLRAYLATRLPEYMLPSRTIFLEEMPMTSSGKIDKSALPSPGRGRPELKNRYVPPRTPVEWFLADLWSGLLGIDAVGVQDHFVELGGDSLVAVEIIAHIWSRYSIEIPVLSLFDYSTIERFSAILAAQMPDSAQSSREAGA
jgi:acyl carrier protein